MPRQSKLARKLSSVRMPRVYAGRQSFKGILVISVLAGKGRVLISIPHSRVED